MNDNEKENISSRIRTWKIIKVVGVIVTLLLCLLDVLMRWHGSLGIFVCVANIFVMLGSDSKVAKLKKELLADDDSNKEDLDREFVSIDDDEYENVNSDSEAEDGTFEAEGLDSDSDSNSNSDDIVLTDDDFEEVSAEELEALEKEALGQEDVLTEDDFK